MIASIVIPTYQRPQLLYRCLKALLQQKFDKTQYEILVVSDGPDAQTEKLLDGLAGYQFPMLRFMLLPAKKGPAAARNHGWQNAQGGIIAFTDDDCIPNAYWLKEIVKHIGSQESAVITGRVVVPISGRPTDYEQNTANLQTADFITANCACTKAALIKAGGFDEQFSMAWREDSDLHFKLLNNQIPIEKVETALVTHPVRSSTWGVSMREQKKTMYDALLYKKHPQLFRKMIRSGGPTLYYGIIIFFAGLLMGLLLKNQPLAITGLVGWAGLTLYFTYKRLAKTSRSLNHIVEMVVTSVAIPFLSVYWQFRGALKYRVLFI